MIGLLFRLPDFMAPASAAAGDGAGDPTASGMIGFVVLAIIVGPVVLLTIAAMFGAPRNFRVPALFLGSLVLLVGAIIVSFAAVGVLLKFVVPQ